ncbi:MAG: DUF5069 domain-containing protein [Opitutaceae bacterium]|jgi:hypothetical protein|nr:DUF5069 domain-containing protein [Opitutaceae bacterium]
MTHYTFPKTFRALYDKAVALYAKGQRGAGTYFTPGEIAFLAANGITAQNLYDYAEDHDNYGEPGYDIALGIELVRRDYYLNQQGGKTSAAILDESRLPSKADVIRGVEWLPRLIPKAKAKLRGELSASLMYCCAGDRRFFKQHDILPHEFLNLVWRHENNDDAIINWVTRRAAAARS